MQSIERFRESLVAKAEYLLLMPRCLISDPQGLYEAMVGAETDGS